MLNDILKLYKLQLHLFYDLEFQIDFYWIDIGSTIFWTTLFD